VLQKTETLDNDFLRDGASYEIWIVLITLIMRSQNLPRGSSTDQRKPSSFVNLIATLQNLALGEGIHSKAALAKRIQRARQRFDSSDISNDGLEEFIYSFLGVRKRPKLTLDEFTLMDEMVEMVLEGKRWGRHPVLPEPLYVAGYD
jgi:hypothetical protein